MIEKKEYKTSELLRRFVPYYRPYRKTMVLDLFCAALTTLCDLVLPLIVRYITNVGSNDLASLTIAIVVKLVIAAVAAEGLLDTLFSTRMTVPVWALSSPGSGAPAYSLIHRT